MELFKNRRKKIMASLPKNSVAVIFAQQQLYRNADTEYNFRQNSDFYYCTGLTEANAILVLYKGNDLVEDILFAKEKTELEEIWHGKVVGYQCITEEGGFSKGYPLYSFADNIRSYLHGLDNIFVGGNLDNVNELLKVDRNLLLKDVDQKFIPATLAKLRLVKSESELSLLKKAIKISIKGHEAIMQNCAPGKHEYEMLAEFTKSCMMQGALELAYPAIIAGSDRACILHYTDNDKRLKDGDLLLVDAGAEYNYYAADLTRTIPVNGKFSPSAALVYDLVLKTQKTVISMIKPKVTLSDLQNTAIQLLAQGLLDLGLLSGSLSEVIATKSYSRFYPHSVSHWLGLDVHDCNNCVEGKGSILLEEGMVLTVEPGLYMRNFSSLPQGFQSLGIRIEDDILVTREGNINLSAELIKERNAIEQFMAG